jgi:hypothetical protein
VTTSVVLLPAILAPEHQARHGRDDPGWARFAIAPGPRPYPNQKTCLHGSRADTGYAGPSPLIKEVRTTWQPKR